MLDLRSARRTGQGGGEVSGLGGCSAGCNKALELVNVGLDMQSARITGGGARLILQAAWRVRTRFRRKCREELVYSTTC